MERVLASIETGELWTSGPLACDLQGSPQESLEASMTFDENRLVIGNPGHSEPLCNVYGTFPDSVQLF